MKDVEIKPIGRKKKNDYKQKYSNIEQKISYIADHTKRFEEFMLTLELMKRKVFENN